MANETFISGDDLVFSIWDGSNSYDPVACVTNSSLSESVEINQVYTKCDPGNAANTPAGYSYEISVEGIYIDEAVDIDKTSHALLAASLRNKTAVEWSMSTGLSGTATQYGTAYITSLELTGEANGNATFSATLIGTGSISSTNPNP